VSDAIDLVPSKPQVVPIRPLSKGLIVNTSPQMTPVGAGREVFNLYAKSEGLVRRDAFQPLITKSGTSLGQIPMSYLAAGEVVQDIIPFFDSTGSYRLIAITNRRMYHCVGNGVWAIVPWGAASYTCTSATNTTFVCAAANFDVGTVSPFTGDRVRAGDIVRCQYSGVWHEYAVTSEGSPSTTLTTAARGTGTTVPDGGIIYIIREFNLTTPYLIDYTYMTDRLVVTDGSNRGVWTYNGSFMADLKMHGIATDADVNYLQGAQTCLFFNGLLFLGKTVESDIDGKHTVRWSSATDVSEFSQVNYVRFNREASPVLKLSAVEDVPIVYLENAIYAGFPSDLTGLPYQFDKVESGGVSAVGMRAMCPSVGGQVFIAYNNIYLLAPTKTGLRQQPEVTAIGDAIAARACKISLDDPRCRAYFDPEREALVFTFCTVEGDHSASAMTSLFYFFTESKAWSQCDCPGMVSVGVMPYTDSLTWANIDAWLLTVGNNVDQWNNTALAGQQWYGLRAASSKMQTIFASKDGVLYRLDPSAQADCFDGTTQVAIKGLFESGEMDFDMIDQEKILSWLTVRIDDIPTIPRAGDTIFTIETSCRRGVWHNRGTILIENQTYEEDCSFRERGSTVAFRVRFNTIQESFRLDEFGLRVRLCGTQISRGP
jgi:hypothetical protein